MIHEFYPHRFNNHYIPFKKIGEMDFIFHYNGDKILLRTCGDEFEIPQKKDFPEIPDKAENTFLFTLDEVPCFLKIAEAAWFTRGDLPDHSLKLSIAGEMIEKFERGEL